MLALNLTCQKRCDGFNSRPVRHPNHNVFTTFDPGVNILCQFWVVLRDRHTGFGSFEGSMVIGNKLGRKINSVLWAKSVVINKNRNNVVKLSANIVNLFSQRGNIVDAVFRLATINF